MFLRSSDVEVASGSPLDALALLRSSPKRGRGLIVARQLFHQSCTSLRVQTGSSAIVKGRSELRKVAAALRVLARSILVRRASARSLCIDVADPDGASSQLETVHLFERLLASSACCVLDEAEAFALSGSGLAVQIDVLDLSEGLEDSFDVLVGETEV